MRKDFRVDGFGSGLGLLIFGVVGEVWRNGFVVWFALVERNRSGGEREEIEMVKVEGEKSCEIV